MKGGDIQPSRFRTNLIEPIKATRSNKDTITKQNVTKKKSVKNKSSDDSVESKNSQKRRERRENLQSGKTEISPVTPDIKQKVFTWDQMHNMGAGEAFKYVYGFLPNVIHSDTENVINTTSARDWWEQTGPQTQCANAIMPIEWGRTECYICGEKLLKNESPPECEHILPVSKAALYLTLYRGDYKSIMVRGFENKLTDENEQRIFNEISMEYDWSHRCCNQKKNDTDFIKYNYNKGVFEIDLNHTRSVLKDIIKGSISKDGHCKEQSLYNKFSKMNKDENKWIKDRVDILNAKNNGKVRVICDYLNKYKEKSKSLFNIINLATLISSADMNKIHSVWRNIEGNPPIKKLPPIVQLSKATIIDDISRFSYNKIKNFDWGRTLKHGRTNFEVDFIKYVFAIYPNINNIKDEEVYKGILGTFIYINKRPELEKLSNFFIVFYSLITYPTLNNPTPLFYGTTINTNVGKKYASNMVANTLKMVYYSLIIKNIEDSKQHLKQKLGIDITNNQNTVINQFKEIFVLELSKELNGLIENYKNYMVELSIPEGNPNYFNIYNDFILLFLKLTENVTLYDNNTSDVKTFLTPIIDEKHNEIGLTMIQKDMNPIIEVKENAIVQFILDETDSLKTLGEWNPENKTETDLINEANGVALGTRSLLELKKKEIDDWLYVEEIGDAIGAYSDENIKKAKNEIIQIVNSEYANYKNDIVQFIKKELGIDEMIQDEDINNKLFELDLYQLNDLIHILKDIQEIEVAADILTNIKGTESQSVVAMDIEPTKTDIDAAQALLGLQDIQPLPPTVEKTIELPTQPPVENIDSKPPQPPVEKKRRREEPEFDEFTGDPVVKRRFGKNPRPLTIGFGKKTGRGCKKTLKHKKKGSKKKQTKKKYSQ